MQRKCTSTGEVRILSREMRHETMKRASSCTVGHNLSHNQCKCRGHPGVSWFSSCLSAVDTDTDADADTDTDADRHRHSHRHRHTDKETDTDTNTDTDTDTQTQTQAQTRT